jgi:hypothetical protein
MEKSVRIITHCWAERYPQYAAFLTYQLSSLILHPPSCRFVIVVCYSDNDDRTHKVLRWFLTNTDHEDLALVALPMNPQRLGRRAIGRDLATKGIEENSVFFTDVDYCFGDGCIDAIAGIDWLDDISIAHPNSLMMQNNHELGDKYWKSVLDDPKIVDVNTSDFFRSKQSRAIGGMQIVGGNFANHYGYLADTEWQNPCHPGEEFKNFKDDVIYRNFCKKYGSQKALSIPNMFRLRHTETSYQ